ncbi:hypothetical protein [Clostridium estertheticum]|uniref:Uncharacterized protein n=1 Tax=Clostridium estertheticum subsp. estertheticum TaxID=1552 RepID=A0A1J0GKX9_9CLOT|nr:hypothetical protein [Clostridium estertheticum]APC42050.1 hypothetical protein A7L45_19320 [Clostridium estertheticum subsp. estertheticum]MBU3174641.1 hypothetical protein [Clostridium estertheticum]MBU3184057.1 hypothetical protein [Clostridium estertheticum]MCB2341120.1 hypothetical protein [Clostridium estertheticum]
MNFLGPFLRVNTLNKNNIRNQFFYLSKESLKDIVFDSKCGIYIPTRDLRSKSFSKIDINTINLNSPLLCVYKKADAKLKMKEGTLNWNESKVKKEITINSNAFMTLSLLELVEYYRSFKKIDDTKYALSSLYLKLCKEQLEFYASYFRNKDGLFVDKKDITDPMQEEFTFEDKNAKFKFSDQAFMMASYYKYYSFVNDEQEYEKFALDILDMFTLYKEEIYNVSFEELNKICLALNIFYKYSGIEKCENLLIDFLDLLIDQYNTKPALIINAKLDYSCMLFINCTLMYNSTYIHKFKATSDDLYEKLTKLYDSEKGLLLKESSEKEVTFTSDEIMLYIYSLMLYSDSNTIDDNSNMLQDIFKHQILDSGIVLSWPDSPSLDDSEHYRNFSLKSEDLIQDDNFRSPEAPTPENNELASIFIKNIVYNRRKENFKQSKSSFDSSKNMFIFFLTIFFHNQ